MLAPPKGGLPVGLETMTLPQYGYRDGLERVQPLVTDSTVARGSHVELAERVRRCTLAEYFGLILSFVDAVRRGGHHFGAACPRATQVFGALTRTPRALRGHSGDRMCCDVCDLAFLASLN